MAKYSLKLVFTALLASLLFLSCQQPAGSFQVIRQPILNAAVDETFWSTRDFAFENLGQVLYYSDNSDNEADVFERVRITAFQKTNSVERLEVVLDVRNANELLGEYSTIYTEKGGIHSFEWIDSPTSGKAYPYYQLCLATDSLVFFNIERESRDEKIISGTFSAILCERKSQSERINITDGEFRDLPYQEQ